MGREGNREEREGGKGKAKRTVVESKGRKKGEGKG